MYLTCLSATLSEGDNILNNKKLSFTNHTTYLQSTRKNLFVVLTKQIRSL